MKAARESSTRSVDGTQRKPTAFRRSPTLDLAERVEEARSRGQSVLSLSTPTFADAEEPAGRSIALRTKLTPAEGDPGLRDAARTGFFARWQLPSHQLMVTAGAKAAIFSALKALVPPASPVLIIAPAWPSYEDIVRLAGLEAVFYETRHETGFTIADRALRERLRATGAGAILLSNPSNPTGRISTGTELRSLSEAAADSKAWLMLDESFSHVVFDRPAWQHSTVSHAQSLVLFNSFSKNFHLQGLRVGVAMVHESRFADVAAVHQTLLSAASSQSQALALASLAASDGDAGQYLSARAVGLRILARAGWDCGPSQGTFHLFPRVGDIEQVQKRMQTEGVFALPGHAFGAAYDEHLRFCFGRPEAEMLEIERRLDRAGLLDRK